MLLRFAFSIAVEFINLGNEELTNIEELLVLANWKTYEENSDEDYEHEQKKYNFQFDQINIDLFDNPYTSFPFDGNYDYGVDSRKNYITYFLEHVAYTKPFKQLKANSQKKFCHFLCYNLANKVCGRCKKVWYCSVQHQRSDWDEHQKTCKSAQVKSRQDSKEKNTRTELQLAKQMKQLEETQKSELLQGQKNTEMQSAQFEQQAEKVVDWDDLKKQQNLLLSYQNQLTPISEISSIDPSSDIQNLPVNFEKSSFKNVAEECKEPQDTIQSKSQLKNQVSNQQAVSLKNLDSVRSSSVNQIDSPESQKILPVVAVTQPISNNQKEDVLISQKTEISQCQINDLEERVTHLEVSKFQLQKENLKLNEKVLKLEQEQFELRQQVKQLMRKFN